MIIKFEYANHIGNRKLNDDSAYIRCNKNKITTISNGGDGKAGVIYATDESELITVAVLDGMGGKRLGGYSAQFCCKRMSAIKNISSNDIYQINSEIIAESSVDYGTTLSVVKINKGDNESTIKLSTISVGDSPIINYENEQLLYLNPLDNLAYQNLLKGNQERNYCGGLKDSNKLLNYIGCNHSFAIHECEYSVSATSKILICTDGILQNKNEDIAAILSHSDRPAEALVRSAISAKPNHSDNSTAIVISFLTDESFDFIVNTDEVTEKVENVSVENCKYFKKWRKKKNG